MERSEYLSKRFSEGFDHEPGSTVLIEEFLQSKGEWQTTAEIVRMAFCEVLNVLKH